ncbi:MAG TPA: HIRAN domain-containing protein [Burkholderiales bacterium]|nr:HIRAN domain-containing protein [Burkholderiales bacterium]
MRWLVAILLAVSQAWVYAGEEPGGSVLVQVSFVTGLQHHGANKAFDKLKVGDALQLEREPHHPDDPNAIRVEWRGRTLGYVSADANESIARQIDFGNRLRARVVRLSKHRNPDRRVEIEIYLPF